MWPIPLQSLKTSPQGKGVEQFGVPSLKAPLQLQACPTHLGCETSKILPI
jgi:hypothetical protein